MSTSTHVFRVEGMHCGSCSMLKNFASASRQRSDGLVHWLVRKNLPTLQLTVIARSDGLVMPIGAGYCGVVLTSQFMP